MRGSELAVRADGTLGRLDQSPDLWPDGHAAVVSTPLVRVVTMGGRTVKLAEGSLVETERGKVPAWDLVRHERLVLRSRPDEPAPPDVGWLAAAWVSKRRVVPPPMGGRKGTHTRGALKLRVDGLGVSVELGAAADAHGFYWNARAEYFRITDERANVWRDELFQATGWRRYGVPDAVLQAGAANFLGMLFALDGALNPVAFHVRSEAIALRVQELLLRLGIGSRLAGASVFLSDAEASQLAARVEIPGRLGAGLTARARYVDLPWPYVPDPVLRVLRLPTPREAYVGRFVVRGIGVFP